MEIAVAVVELIATGHLVLAVSLIAAGFGVLYLNERRKRGNERQFRSMLEEHDSKNERDFGDIRNRLDAQTKEIHEIGQRLARIEGALMRKDGP